MNSYQKIADEVIDELISAKSKFPAKFVNQHEAYAVILEEVDELWDEIKKNQKVYDLEKQRTEAIQAAAMLLRFVSELIPFHVPKNGQFVWLRSDGKYRKAFVISRTDTPDNELPSDGSLNYHMRLEDGTEGVWNSSSIVGIVQ